MRARSVWAALALVAASAGVLVGGTTSATGSPTASTAVPRPDCGPGSRPETELQGQVSLADRLSGRNKQGYSCNLSVVGQYQGEWRPRRNCSGCGQPPVRVRCVCSCG